MILKIRKYLSILTFVLILISCNTQKKYLRYKESVATITDKRELSPTNPVLVTIVTGETMNTNGVSWSDYVFTADNGKEYGGEDLAGFDPGEKFVVMYDTTKRDNDHSYLVYYKPLFLEGEKTVQCKGKIARVYWKDRQRQGALATIITYSIKLPTTGTNDSSIVNFKRYQYFSPTTSIDSLKKYPNKEYRVLYSPENPKRAILYLD